MRISDWSSDVCSSDLIRIIDGLGSTEMLHIFVTSAGDGIRPGATGKAIPGFEARVVDERGNPVPPGTVGRLAVRGPTGCRYLDNPERQAAYVKDGWNFTGDAYIRSEEHTSELQSLMRISYAVFCL